jgi:hypothetical protein
VGLVCRVVEESGIATVCLSTGRDLTAQVRPPRSVFVNYPMGNAFGKPFDIEMQTKILRHCLTMAESCDTPGAIVDLPDEWREPFEFNPGGSKM